MFQGSLPGSTMYTARQKVANGKWLQILLSFVVVVPWAESRGFRRLLLKKFAYYTDLDLKGKYHQNLKTFQNPNVCLTTETKK